VHGRVDGPIPESKLVEFQRAVTLKARKKREAAKAARTTASGRSAPVQGEKCSDGSSSAKQQDGVGSNKRSHYDVLGLPPTCSTEELRPAWKRRMLEVHPDKGGSSEEFLAVNQAFELLGNAKTRRAFDQQLLREKRKSTALMK